MVQFMIQDANSINVMDGFTDTVSTDLSIDGSDITFDGRNLITNTGNNKLIEVYSGVSETLLNSYTSNGNAGIVFDGQNIIVSDIVTQTIFVTRELTTELITSFDTPGTFPGGLAFDFDSLNLLSLDKTTDEVSIHDGVSSTVSSTLDAPGVDPFGLYYNYKQLIVSTEEGNTIFILDDLSESELTSFSGPATLSRGISADIDITAMRLKFNVFKFG